VNSGIEEARRQAVTKHERLVVEAAHQVLSEEAEKVGFTYSGFALTNLPHKEHKDRVWRREGRGLTMVIQSGINRLGKEIGIPYGSCARLILLFLQTEAIRTKSREIEIGNSMHLWLTNMGMSAGGNTYRIVMEQAKRIATCHLTFISDDTKTDSSTNGAFVRHSMFSKAIHEDGQLALWESAVVLDEYFYKELSEHPVPINEDALKAIGPKSLVINLYIWLAYRLHSLKRDQRVGWLSLYTQFGSGYKHIRQFRFKFLEALELAVAAYPEARLTADEAGLILLPSKPPIAVR
jgi:hypothetical protein